AGLKLLGPIGALGGWICAGESCRLILLRRAARLFGTGLLGVLPRELWLPILAAAISAVPGGLALRPPGGPLIAQLCVTRAPFVISSLVARGAMGVLPPVRAWIPQRKPEWMGLREAA